MAIQFNGNRDVAQPVTRNHAPVTRDVTRQQYLVAEFVPREEFDTLKAEVAALRELIARQAVAPSTNKRAAYMREYRKRAKP